MRPRPASQVQRLEAMAEARGELRGERMSGDWLYFRTFFILQQVLGVGFRPVSLDLGRFRLIWA
jgi:hypothetical protein